MYSVGAQFLPRPLLKTDLWTLETEVMIFKIFSQKNGEKMAFLLKLLPVLAKFHYNSGF
jgi:hypothetical protein